MSYPVAIAIAVVARHAHPCFYASPQNRRLLFVQYLANFSRGLGSSAADGLNFVFQAEIRDRCKQDVFMLQMLIVFFDSDSSPPPRIVGSVADLRRVWCKQGAKEAKKPANLACVLRVTLLPLQIFAHVHTRLDCLPTQTGNALPKLPERQAQKSRLEGGSVVEGGSDQSRAQACRPVDLGHPLPQRRAACARMTSRTNPWRRPGRR